MLMDANISLFLHLNFLTSKRLLMTMISKLSLRFECLNSSSEDGQQVFQITFRKHKDIHSIHKHKDIHSILCTASRDQPLDQLLVQQLAQQISCHSNHNMDIHNIHKHKDVHNIHHTTSKDQPLAQQISCHSKHMDIHNIHKDVHNIHRTTSKDQPLDQHLVRMRVHLLQVQQTSCHSKHMDIHNIRDDHKHKDNIPHITSSGQLWDQPLVQVLAQQKLQQ